MARVALSAIPGPGWELEDYVSALFQAAGYFVERGIHERAFTDVLELDAVATRYSVFLPIPVLVEAKGGRWRFPDVFKIAGWMRYLGILQGGFFVANDTSAGNLPQIHRKIAPLGIALVALGDFRDAAARFERAGFGSVLDPFLTEFWRYSFWVERALLDRLRSYRRASPRVHGFGAVLGYHELVHDHVFFIRDLEERLGLLYQAYRAHPKLSLALAGELEGGPFSAAPPRRSPLLAAAIHDGKHPEIQASFYVEHRGRLSILKAAVDELCARARQAQAAPTPPGLLPVAPGFVSRDRPLPATFRDGLRVLGTRPSFPRYALLWQVFLWGFGGFYLADRADEEFAWLSLQTGVPVGEIPTALAAFDDLFPLAEGSWIVPLKNTRIMAVKMVPTPFRGLGALQRLRRYGARVYQDLRYSDATCRDLARWHNAAVALLAA